MALILITIAVVAVALLWLLPGLQLRSTKGHLKNAEIELSDYLKAENDRRVTIAQIFGGLVVLAGLFYSGRTVRLQESGQVTDRINKAVEQLGQSNVPVNLGGIHQLARIATDYDEERYPMLQVLASFVEVRAALPALLQVTDCDPFKIRQYEELPVSTSQAIINVLADQIPKLKGKQEALEINHVSLRYVDFSGGRFGVIQLAGDDLTGAHFIGSQFSPQSVLASSQFIFADLTESNLSGVSLHHTCMAQARLRNAVLRDADLSYADFRAVEDLQGADLSGANLDHADMRGVDLTPVKGLTAQQLKTVKCDGATQFPQPLASLRATLECTKTPDL